MVLSIESDVGWYVVITQDCDIARDPNTEPWAVWLSVPLRTSRPGNGQALASGPRSPRYFPLPDGKFPGMDGKLPIADLFSVPD